MHAATAAAAGAGVDSSPASGSFALSRFRAVAHQLLSSHYRSRYRSAVAELAATASARLSVNDSAWRQQQQLQLRLDANTEQAQRLHAQLQRQLARCEIELRAKDDEVALARQRAAHEAAERERLARQNESLAAAVRSSLSAASSAAVSAAGVSFLSASHRGDYLHAHDSQRILGVLHSHGDRHVVFAARVQRCIAARNNTVARQLVLSERAMYLLVPSSAAAALLDVRVPLSDVTRVSLSHLRADVAVLHVFGGGRDVLLITDKRSELMLHLLRTHSTHTPAHAVNESCSTVTNSPNSLRYEFGEQLFVSDAAAEPASHRQVSIAPTGEHKLIIGRAAIIAPVETRTR